MIDRCNQRLNIKSYSKIRFWRTIWTTVAAWCDVTKNSAELLYYREDQTDHPQPGDRAALVCHCPLRLFREWSRLCPPVHWWRDIEPTLAATAKKHKECSGSVLLMRLINVTLLTGVIHANINNGSADSPSNHRHPSVGATTRASATSKHAPNAQKH